MEMPAIFYEVHSNLPREGPGDNQSTEKAFKALKNLPANPRILDIGCGPGMQTIKLAELSGGKIEAVDNHQSFLDQLNLAAKTVGVSNRIIAVKGDMFKFKYKKASFDLIWCEGAIFIIGFDRGLCEWKTLLKNGGYLVVSELSYFKKDVPKELEAYLKEMYAGLENSEARTVEENVASAKKLGFKVLKTFALPKSGWWDNYYAPIEVKLAQLKAKYKNEPEALQYIAAEEREIEMFQKYSDYYGYAFYILQRA